jgi:hypothetical protein
MLITISLTFNVLHEYDILALIRPFFHLLIDSNINTFSFFIYCSLDFFIRMF